MIDRRTFLHLLGAGIGTLALSAHGQQAGKVWRIGILGNQPPGTTPETDSVWQAFLQALNERGFVEGKNLAFEMRFVEGRSERSAALAGELVRLGVDVIVISSGGPTIRAAKEATATIPIVMVGTSDPVGAGLVANLARPGGNITGMADLQIDLTAKRLELLKIAVPKAARVAYVHGNFSGFDAAKLDATRKEVDVAAQTLGMSLLRIPMYTPQDFENANAVIVRERPDALLIAPNPVNFLLRKEIAELAARQRLPAIAARRQEAAAGMLMTYGPSVADLFRNAGIYVAKILNGAKPADLPVEQPTKLELVINLKTAKVLGITIPQSLLLRADQVIQ